MIRNNKVKFLISSLIILLPALVGLLLWNRLPDTLTTHWGIDGNPDGFGSKLLAVFLLPLIFLATHILCLLVTGADPKNKKQTPKTMGMIFWITPAVSLFSSGIIYGTAFGMSFSLTRLMPALLGLMFVVVGNYLPKCKQNYTLGIKLPWTLGSEENWNCTHRLGGKVWFIGGLLIILSVFLPENITPAFFISVLLLLVAIPTVYSYCFYKKEQKNGTPQTALILPPQHSLIHKLSLVFVAVLLVFVIVLLTTGSITCICAEDSFTLKATYWDDLTVSYDAVDHIEYRETCVVGDRTSGFGSPRLLMGSFHNEEFGSYTRYSYTACDACIVLTIDEKTLVISDTNAESTLELYQTLCAALKK